MKEAFSSYTLVFSHVISSFDPTPLINCDSSVEIVRVLLTYDTDVGKRLGLPCAKKAM